MSNSLSPTPNTPLSINQMLSSSNVNLIKTATPDIVLFDDDSVPTEQMVDLIFENIGGQELVNIARNDTINGQNISYQPIKNIRSIQQSYNSNNILGLQKTSDKYFSGFSIRFDQKTPNEGNGLNGTNVYVDNSGNLVIEAVGLNNDEQLEVQLSTSGTIYTIQFDGNES
jgi:hypothetical protein